MRPSGLPADFFIRNRRELCRRVKPDSLVFIQSAPQTIRNADSLNSWRQESDFYYFSGIDYPECSLLLVPNSEDQHDEILFIPPLDPVKEKWQGRMLTKEEAQETSGIKTIQSSGSLLSTLFRVQKWRETLYCELNEHFPELSLTPQHLLLSDLRTRLPGLQQRKLHFLTAPLRVKKQAEEINLIVQSLAIIKSALDAVMSNLRPGLKEYQIEAELTYHYTYNGCKRHGFDPIVASGKNATILHYVENSDTLSEGDLILIDTGGEFQMYSGDITRVFPVSGVFSERQKQCYQAVLDINKAFINEVKPGLSWNQLYDIAGQLSGDIFAQNGFIDDPKKHTEVGYHRIGHYLGLDIHDVGRLDVPMEPGAVITVEPGLYLPAENIGVRIEDNVLITESGCQVLSADIPKEITEIENRMSGGVKQHTHG